MRIGIKLSAMLMAASALCAARGARADERFAHAGNFAISAERLMGIVYATDKAEGTISNTDKSTSITFLYNPAAVLTNYSYPRIAFDYFPIDGLSLGGSVGFLSLSRSETVSGGNVSQDQDLGSTFGFLINPRVGYAFMFSPKVGLWPRGGITFNSLHTSGDNDASATNSRLALTIEAPLVIVPIPHVAIYVAPTLDLGLSGSNSTKAANTSTTNSVDHTATDIGLQAGLGMYF